MNFMILLPFWSYTAKILTNLEEVYEEGLICYVSLNKPYKALKPLLIKGDLHPDRFRVVDAVTKSVLSKAEPEPHCVYVSAPNSFEELHSQIVETITKEKCRVLVFDSITSLLIYQTIDEAIVYLKKICSTADMFGCEALFTALEDNLDEETLARLRLVMDKVVDMTPES